MSKQQGTAHKNKVSESIGPSQEKKFEKMLLANEELEEKARNRRAKEPEKFGSVPQLMRSTKGKKHKSKKR
ncbi:MAG: hypothetical protein WCT49_06570 [Candidatus Paceibacterota bacterium]|jgi:hypothetical protein|nr:hypothetical protein [Candidatus Paceibacterota bacterium]